MKKILSEKETAAILTVFKERFEINISRHKNISWTNILSRLKANPEKLYSLYLMEKSGGAPDVIEYGNSSKEYFIVDCSVESPAGRRSVCYDVEALKSRKENKPKNSAVSMANEMGIELLNEEQYRKLHEFGAFDTKTSSWILTPPEIRNLGGAVFADFRYGKIFIYHNGAESYYAARGFRGLLRL